MAEAITQPCNKWCSSMVWSKREGRKCTYTYTYESSATSESDPARAEFIRFTVDQYTNATKSKVKLASTQQDLALNAGEFTFDLVDKCRYFYFTMQLRNSLGASGNLSWNEQVINPPPHAKDLKIVYDATVAGNSITYGFTGVNNVDQQYRNEPRRSYTVSIVREQILNGVASADWSSTSTNVLGFDNSETVDWSKTATFTKPTRDSDSVHFYLAVGAIPLYDEGWIISKKHYYIALPPKPAIADFTRSTNGEGATVSVQYNQAYKYNVPTRPMDKLSLQVQYATSAAALTASGWASLGDEQTVESCEGNVTTCFYVADADIAPGKNQHVFIRAKAAWQTLTPMYSEPFMVPDEYYYRQAFTYEDSASETGSDGVTISSVTTGDDCQSLVAVIGYDNITNYNACELGYSTDKDAWWSTKQPDTIEMPDTEWRWSEKLAPKNTYCSKIKVADLDEETTYYLRARRYKTDDDTKKTAWSVVKEGNTGGEELTGLVLTAGDIVATGSPCSFTWNFPDGLKQTKWVLRDATTNADLENGTGTITMSSHAFSTAGVKKVIVTSYFDNGKSMDSDVAIVKVVDPPTIAFSSTPAATITTLPFAFTVKTNTEGAELQVRIVSMGIQTRTPTGFENQYSGDVVYSQTATGKTLYNSVDNTNANRLWNGGRYMILATATANGVTSEVLTHTFTVNYSSRVSAPEPKYVTIKPASDKSASIKVSGLASGVTWDLYRATTDMRNQLIASNLANNTTVTDKFAPYSTGANCKYVVLVKNTRRQFDFRAYEYSANYGVLRFDWDNNYVELPYNIEISDETDKQFEQQIYLDGAQRGAWGASVVRSASLSTDTVYIKDEEVQKKVRELARYQGAVLVRTPLGQAYTANVEVKNINKTYDKKAMAVSFTCTEIDITSDFTIQS